MMVLAFWTTGLLALLQYSTSARTITWDNSLPIFEEEDRIVGGIESVDGEYPYIVSIQIIKNVFNPNANFVHACGGSILNSDWIITAGHCSTFGKQRYRIVAGAYDLLHPTGTEQVRKVIRIVTHPRYNASTVDYDIAVIQVTPPFDLNDRVQPVHIQEDSFASTGVAETAGWGLLHKDDKDTPAILQKIHLPLISEPQCHQIYSRLNLTITDRMICAGYDEGESVCNGDSGGPLMCSTGVGESRALCGLVSWGIPCAVRGYPGVFTKVHSVLDFINEHVSISSWHV